MLNSVDDWDAYLSDVNKSNDDDLVKLNTRTGWPLGDSDFVFKLESITGLDLACKKPGRKLVVRK